MQPLRQSVIDVGTNSVKLLVAEVRQDGVDPVLEKSWQTRLGRGFYAHCQLHPEAIAQTAAAIEEFARLAKQMESASIRVIATSAAREAKNLEDLVQAIQKSSGLKLEVISGEQEADWVYRGVRTDANLASHSLMILDVGGGSSEFVLGSGARFECCQSLNLGSVRLLERLQPGDPPGMEELARCRKWLDEFLHQQVASTFLTGLGKLESARTVLVGTGGTTSILARMRHQLETYDRQQMEGTRLSREQVSQETVRLWSLTLDQRKLIAGLPPSRADVMLAGAAIFEAVMNYFQSEELYVSTRGLRFGALVSPNLGS